MTPEQRYLALQRRIKSLAFSNSRGLRELFDELLSVADLAFAQALADSHRCKVDLDDFICLRVSNRMRNFMRGERRRRLRVWPVDVDTLNSRPSPQSLPDALYGLSEDAVAVAETIMACPVEGLKNVKGVIYAALGWRRAINCFEEIRAALEG